MSTITLSSRPRALGEILTQRVSGTLVLLNVQSGLYYTLDEVGARVWELSDGHHIVSEIASILSQEYDAAASTIEADALDLLEDLANEKLVEDHCETAARSEAFG